MMLLAVGMLIFPAAADGIGGSTATIAVTSSPSGAVVYDAGEYKGTTPCTITVYTTGTPINHNIVVSKNGYYDYHQYIGDVTANQYISVNAVLTPVAQTGYIDVSSSPSGANVYVDGIYYGTTETVVTVDAGSHSVRLEKPGYNTWYGSTSVSAGQTSYLSPVLTSSASYGYLNVQSHPSGAAIYVDGNYRDTTPATLSTTAETHTVKLVLAGYQVYTQTLSVGSGATAYITADLVSSADAYLKVASTPAGAAVYVDGNYCGNTGYSSSSSPNYMSVGPLSASTHSVVLKKDGYNTYTSTVTLSANEIRSMSVTLVPTSPTPAGLAALHLDSTPSGADVYVDNVFRGYTPIYLTDISEGQHTLLLQHTGYNDWTQYVTFTAGQTVEMDVPLTTAGVPTAPTQSPFPVLALAGLAAAVVLLRRF